jgi:hypothetical protein
MIFSLSSLLLLLSASLIARETHAAVELPCTTGLVFDSLVMGTCLVGLFDSTATPTSSMYFYCDSSNVGMMATYSGAHMYDCDNGNLDSADVNMSMSIESMFGAGSYVCGECLHYATYQLFDDCARANDYQQISQALGCRNNSYPGTIASVSFSCYMQTKNDKNEAMNPPNPVMMVNSYDGDDECTTMYLDEMNSTMRDGTCSRGPDGGGPLIKVTDCVGGDDDYTKDGASIMATTFSSSLLCLFLIWLLL